LEYFPELVCRLKAMLERFADALSYIAISASSLMICSKAGGGITTARSHLLCSPVTAEQLPKFWP